MDRDTTSKKDAHKKLIEAMSHKKVDVLVGTQMVSKGHHLPGVALVGVVNADTGLNMPDFRAAERTFQLLTQVAGRAGRGEKTGRVVVQTFSPEHPSIVAAQTHDFPGFYEKEIAGRRELGLPPFSRMARVVVSSSASGLAKKFAHKVGQHARSLAKTAKVEVLGPAEAPLARIRGRFRHHLILKGEGALSLNRVAAKLLNIQGKPAKISIRVDIDPQQML
jgi:primosomal protein N' (replication factor Y)